MLTRWPVFNLKLYNEKSMLYCLPSEVDLNIEKRSDEIFESTILSSLLCIQIFYVIIELILELIHMCKQNKKFTPKLVLSVNFFVYG